MPPTPPSLKTYTSYPELQGGPYTILYESTLATGVRLPGEIDAESLDAARAMLEAQGHRDILFYSDRIMAVVGLYMREHSQLVAQSRPSPAVRLAGLKLGGKPKNPWLKIGMHAVSLLALLLLLGVGIVYDNWCTTTTFAIPLVLYTFLLWKILLPMHLYNALESAKANCRWSTVLMTSALLSRLYRRLIMPNEMHFARANAYIRIGQTEKALRHIEQAREGPFMPEWIWAPRASHAYLQMGRHAEGLELARRGFEGSFKESSQHIDLAHFLIKHGGEDSLAEAQALLTAASTMAVTEMGKVFYWLAWGMWAARMGRTDDALGYLYGAEQACIPFSGMWGMLTMARIIQVEKALVLARGGRAEEARKLIEPLRPLLARRLYPDGEEELRRWLPA